jgi:DNA repair protein RadD
MIELRHYQAGCTPAIVKYLKANPGKHPLVALPTGAGKTYCIADLIKFVRSEWKINVLVISHVKEILEQNYKSLSVYIDEKIGIHSSGLGKREVESVTVAGIQSIYRNPARFSKFNLIIIDEAHLISPEDNTMYKKFIAGIGKHICVGFTATPFRLGSGYIYGDGQLFNKLVYDWTTAERFQQLVDEGFLSPLSTKRTALEMDTSGIKLVGGDFNEKDLAERFDRDGVTNEAIKEIIAAGVNRNKWLIFAIDISHAEHIAEVLIRNGIKCAPVHSTMNESGFSREKVIEDFKNGTYKAVVNVNILTTGFDDPGIDLIAMLRPTNSPVLHVQTLGRGSRISPDKENCLVLDFAGNTARLGPINDVVVKKKGKGKEGGDPITKTCPKCNEILPPAVKICPCGYEFPFEHHLSPNAYDIDVMENGKSKWVDVDDVEYSLNKKFGAPTTVKVTYTIGRRKVSEWVCIEHSGFAKHKANHWVKFRGGEPCNTAEDLMKQKDKLAKPDKILVSKKGNYHVINDSKFSYNTQPA